MPRLGRASGPQLRERDTQHFVVIDPIAEEVRAHPLDDTRYGKLLTIDIDAEVLFGGVGIVEFGDKPQDERRYKERDKYGRDGTSHPLP